MEAFACGGVIALGDLSSLTCPAHPLAAGDAARQNLTKRSPPPRVCNRQTAAREQAVCQKSFSLATRWPFETRQRRPIAIGVGMLLSPFLHECKRCAHRADPALSFHSFCISLKGSSHVIHPPLPIRKLCGKSCMVFFTRNSTSCAPPLLLRVGNTAAHCSSQACCWRTVFQPAVAMDALAAMKGPIGVAFLTMVTVLVVSRERILLRVLWSFSPRQHAIPLGTKPRNIIEGGPFTRGIFR